MRLSSTAATPRVSSRPSWPGAHDDLSVRRLGGRGLLSLVRDDMRVMHNTHPALRPCWHPVAYARDVGADPVRVTLLGEHYVLVQLDGVISAFPDQCPHRGAPLSAGTIVDGTLQCAYHGFRYGTDGT